jgi:hypothetical protein
VHQDGIWWLDVNGDKQFDATDIAAGPAYFGGPGFDPVVGDFNGDGVDDPGVHQGGVWWLDFNGNRQFDASDMAAGPVYFGGPGLNPVVGDFSGDGVDDVGVHADGVWWLDFNGNLEFDPSDAAAGPLYFGGPGLQAVVGKWDFSGTPLKVEAAAAPAPSTAEDLTLDSLQAVVDTAIDLMADAGATAGELERLQDVSLSVTDLAGDKLAVASGSAIQIDDDAAGYGWFVDATPADNVEFAIVGPHELVATADSPATDRVDLLTVVLHEMGHILGHGHDDKGVMDDTLPVSTRRVWEDLDWLEDDLDGPIDADDLNAAAIDGAFKAELRG